MGAVLSKRGSLILGASRLYIEQRGNQLDVIFDAMLQLPPDEFVAPASTAFRSAFLSSRSINRPSKPATIA